METVIFIGKGNHRVKIVNRSTRAIVGRMRTKLDGSISYEFPDDGIYNIICVDDQKLSKFNIEYKTRKVSKIQKNIAG